MHRPLISKSLMSLLIGLGTLSVVASTAPAAANGPRLSETSMTEAIRYLGVLAGRNISAGDAAWLKQQWQAESVFSPYAIANEVDDLALGFELHGRGPDALATANVRTALVENVYCSAEQTSDPAMHRLRDILAPESVVLAADCMLGQVVTRFDIDGLVASHALIAAAAGQGHDAEADRREIMQIIDEGFKEATPAEKSMIASGELRSAILARFWSRIDGTPTKQAAIDEIQRLAASDLRGTARELEKLAMSGLGDVDYLAKVGDAKLSTGAIDSYIKWLERIAGYALSTRDRAWLQQAIIDEFREEPVKVLDEVASIEVMNRDYAIADSVEEKAGMSAGWAAGLHCYLSASSDPDEVRLAEVLFRHDPVTDVDCQAGRLTRHSDTVLVEAGGQTLTVRDLSPSTRFASVLIGRALLPEEEAVIREDNIQSFQKDLDSWNENQALYNAFLDKTQRPDSRFLGMAERKKFFDPIYCELKTSDDPFADDYLEMFQRGGAILFENCDQKLVTTKEEMESMVGSINFLALLNGRPPLGEADEQELRETLKPQNLNNAETTMLALNEWWSLLTLDEKVGEIAKFKEQGITLEADAETISQFLNLAKLKVVTRNAALKNCQMMAIVSQGNTAIYAAKGGLSEGDFGGLELANLVSFNGMAAELCQLALGGG